MKLLAVYDFNPKVMNLQEKEELLIIFKRFAMTEQKERVLKNADNLYAPDTSSLPKQDKQIILEDKSRALKVSGYSRRNKTSDIQDKTVKMNSVIHEVDILTSDGKSHWESNWESKGELEGELDMELKGKKVDVCHRNHDISDFKDEG